MVGDINMVLLRWVLGAGCAAGLGVFGLILGVGKGFDAFRSGAGGEDGGRQALTVAIPLLLAMMLGTVAAPGQRWLMHATAVLVLAAMVGVAVEVLRTNPGEGAIYEGFFVLWAVYYAAAVWGGGK